MFSKITLAQFFTNAPYLESGCKVSQSEKRPEIQFFQPKKEISKFKAFGFKTALCFLQRKLEQGA